MKKGAYFSLKEECRLVFGATRAAIYDLGSGEVYALDEEGRDILGQSERGVPLSRITDQGADKAHTTDFFAKISALGLGHYRETPPARAGVKLPEAEFVLRKIFLEVTARCNLRCVHCYADASPTVDPQPMSLEKWLGIIQEGARLGAQWIQLIGGEPLLFGKKNIFTLITQARSCGYRVIEVFSNGLLISDEYVSFFAENQVQVAVSVYARQPEIHDRITQCPGSHRRTMANVQKLKEAGVPVRFGVVVMRDNCAYEQETVRWIAEEFSPQSVCSDVIRCTSGGRRKQSRLLTPDLWRRQLRAAPIFAQVPFDRFMQNRSGHSCLCGTVCVQADGRVYPCIMDRTHVLGDLRQDSLEEIIYGPKTREIWGLSKDQVAVCRDCEFRYACTDCRPLIIKMNEALAEPHSGLQAKDPCCLYDPYKGEWGEVNAFMEKVAAHGLLESEPLV